MKKSKMIAALMSFTLTFRLMSGLAFADAQSGEGDEFNYGADNVIPPNGLEVDEVQD